MYINININNEKNFIIEVKTYENSLFVDLELE